MCGDISHGKGLCDTWVCDMTTWLSRVMCHNVMSRVILTHMATLLSTLTSVTKNCSKLRLIFHHIDTNVNWFSTEIGNSKTATTMFQSTLWLLEGLQFTAAASLQGGQLPMIGTLQLVINCRIFLPIFIFVWGSRDCVTMTTWFESSDIKYVCMETGQ